MEHPDHQLVLELARQLLLKYQESQGPFYQMLE